jgi:hypothetical protein
MDGIKSMKELVPRFLKDTLEKNAKSECPLAEVDYDRFLIQIEEMESRNGESVV